MKIYMKYRIKVGKGHYYIIIMNCRQKLRKYKINKCKLLRQAIKFVSKINFSLKTLNVIIIQQPTVQECVLNISDTQLHTNAR